MQMTEREAQPQFSQPVRQIFLMLVAIGLFAAGAWLAWPRVAPVFLANVWLNGVIGLVFVIGVLACFLQVIQLVTSVSWIEGFAAERPGHEVTRAPRLLAPLAALLRSRGKRMQISPTSGRSILESVGTRIEEARDITRYLVNLLIFLGLLGTFYGLATTVPAVVETIRSLAPQEGESGIAVFDKLMSGLEAQLGGMGTAFSSSLLGLAGSLVVGLLELFAGHGQNRFYRELEEWLSTITRLGFATAEGEGAGETGADGAMALSLAGQAAEQVQALSAAIAAAEEGRAALEARVAQLADAVETLGVHLEAEAHAGPARDALLERIAAAQEHTAQALAGGFPAAAPGALGRDDEERARLRSIDLGLARLIEEVAENRVETLADLRGDLARLTRALERLAPQAGGDDARWS